ncbi:hypothetical protein SNF32_08570 [Enterococcus mundtii]|nr:hypothetical protein [Enterococcus mundtii]
MKQLREERGYTQKDVASSINLNISVYQK